MLRKRFAIYGGYTASLSSYFHNFRRKGLLMKKIGKIFIIIILAIVLVAAGITAFLTITEFKPEEEEVLDVTGVTEKKLNEGGELTLLTYNIGYGGLSADMDLYTEGGEGVKASTESLINRNLDCIRLLMKEQNCDVLMLQTVDKKAERSFKVDEVTYLRSLFPGLSSYAQNYKCKFIPLPLRDPLGSVDSGLLTINRFPVTESDRLALASGYSWPMKLFKPKNCLQVQRVLLGEIPPAEVKAEEEPAATEEEKEGEEDEKEKEKKKKKDDEPAPVSIPSNGGPELIIVNAHFESLDGGSIKIEQTKALANFVKDEYAKGNYVIIGGTFNQTFPGSDSTLYPLRDTSNFLPGVLEETLFGEGWSFAYDQRTPTARLCNTPYSELDPYAQLYVIDGFITSPNVSVKGVYTIDTGFKFSNHQPVKLRVQLKASGTAVIGQPEPQPAAETADATGGAVAAPGMTAGNGGFAIGEGVLATDGTIIEGTN